MTAEREHHPDMVISVRPPKCFFVARPASSATSEPTAWYARMQPAVSVCRVSLDVRPRTRPSHARRTGVGTDGPDGWSVDFIGVARHISAVSARYFGSFLAQVTITGPSSPPSEPLISRKSTLPLGGYTDRRREAHLRAVFPVWVLSCGGSPGGRPRKIHEQDREQGLSEGCQCRHPAGAHPRL